VEAAENTAAKQRGRPFEPGKSGNPSGRPKRSRNHATLLAEALLEGEAETITRKLIDKALELDTTALRMCLERLAAPNVNDVSPLSFPRSKLRPTQRMPPRRCWPNAPQEISPPVKLRDRGADIFSCPRPRDDGD